MSQLTFAQRQLAWRQEYKNTREREVTDNEKLRQEVQKKADKQREHTKLIEFYQYCAVYADYADKKARWWSPMVGTDDNINNTTVQIFVYHRSTKRVDFYWSYTLGRRLTYNYCFSSMVFKPWYEHYFRLIWLVARFRTFYDNLKRFQENVLEFIPNTKAKIDEWFNAPLLTPQRYHYDDGISRSTEYDIPSGKIPLTGSVVTLFRGWYKIHYRNSDRMLTADELDAQELIILGQVEIRNRDLKEVVFRLGEMGVPDAELSAAFGFIFDLLTLRISIEITRVFPHLHENDDYLVDLDYLVHYEAHQDAAAPA